MKLFYAKVLDNIEIEFDAVIREQHTRTSTVTPHPVEVGADVTDHVRADPERLSVEAWVSNTPLKMPTTQNRGVTGRTSSEQMTVPISRQVARGERETTQSVIGVNALRFDGKFDRMRDVYKELRTIQEESIVVSVLSEEKGGLRDYENMVLTNLSLPVTIENGTALGFTFDLVNIKIVSTQRVDAAQEKKKQRKGQQGKKEVTAEQPKKSQSLLKSGDKAKAVFRAITGAFGG